MFIKETYAIKNGEKLSKKT